MLDIYLPTQTFTEKAKETKLDPDDVATAARYEDEYSQRLIQSAVIQSRKLYEMARDEKKRYVLAHLFDHTEAAGMPVPTTEQVDAILNYATELHGDEITDINSRLASATKFWAGISRQELFFHQKMGISLYPTDDSELQMQRGLVGFNKTGSELSIHIPENGELTDFRFYNKVPVESAGVWEYVHEMGIPVARILGKQDSEAGSVTIESCFEGDNLDMIPMYFRELMPVYMDEINRQKLAILGVLNTYGIDHGHAHDANFVNAFYPINQLDLYQSSNVNLIDPSKIKLSNNYIDVLRVPSGWFPLVRLIDWDRAKFSENL